MTEMLTEGRFRAGLDVYEAQSVWLFGRVPVEGDRWDAFSDDSDVHTHEIILTIRIGNEYQLAQQLFFAFLWLSTLMPIKDLYNFCKPGPVISWWPGRWPRVWKERSCHLIILCDLCQKVLELRLCLAFEKRSSWICRMMLGRAMFCTCCVQEQENRPVCPSWLHFVRRVYQR